MNGCRVAVNGCDCPKCLSKYGCKCCYCELSGKGKAGANHNATAAREKLRQKLGSKKKDKKLKALGATEKVDSRAVDDLLSFIEGSVSSGNSSQAKVDDLQNDSGAKSAKAMKRERQRKRKVEEKQRKQQEEAAAAAAAAALKKKEDEAKAAANAANSAAPSSSSSKKKDKKRAKQKLQKEQREAAAAAAKAAAKVAADKAVTEKEAADKAAGAAQKVAANKAKLAADSKSAATAAAAATAASMMGGAEFLTLEQQLEAGVGDLSDLLPASPTSRPKSNSSRLSSVGSSDFEQLDEDDDFAAELEMFKSFMEQPVARPTERQKVKINMGAIRMATGSGAKQ